ncbi:dTDP-glucose 4,6-dehydratase-like [Liolophura sinensis]|uniref:dTDP-glucose 4,6-dehydratase-like n=1 Tax=Liolophura sinensis TaxID=3198878 RepID=UPI003157FADC
MAESGARDSVLILGGTGFIGRNLVHYLISNELAGRIRVADKVPPQMAWLNPTHKEAFANPKVQFKHSNLINPVSVENAFTDPEGEFDYVINLAAETKYGQTDAVYRDGIMRLSLNCAREAAKRKVKRYLEVSSGQMNSSEKPIREDSKCNPWTQMAKHKHSVERELSEMADLNYVIARPAIVYGPGDRQGLTPRLVIGAVYKYTKEVMKMLWTKDLKMNTVHVEDVCRALWHLCHHGNRGEIYNIVDDSGSTQGLVNELVSQIYNINHDYVGSAISSIAKLNMSSVVEDINDKHMEPWADACQRDGILNTPLNPFIDQELLYNKHLCLDGQKLKDTGFVYRRPEVEINSLREVLDDFLKMGIFPSSLLSSEMIWRDGQARNGEGFGDQLEEEWGSG